jgi:hypothetical protein
MKKTRRNYTREFKLEALRLLETSGKSAPQIERDLGIGKGNLYRWKRKLPWPTFAATWSYAQTPTTARCSKNGLPNWKRRFLSRSL